MLIIIEGIVLLIGSQEGNHLKYSEWRYLSRPHFLHDDRYLAKVNTQPFRLFDEQCSSLLFLAFFTETEAFRNKIDFPYKYIKEWSQF